MHIEYIRYNYSSYICNLYLCKVPQNFTGIYYHTLSQHKYGRGGKDNFHHETAYQVNTNIVLKNELADENNAIAIYSIYDSQGRWVYETNKNVIETSMFIKNGYICMRYGFKNRPDFENNLVDVGRNFDLRIYIIS